MAAKGAQARLNPLQRVIYDVEQLGLPVREAIRIVTQRVGFFVGQQKYLDERARMQAILAEYGDPALPVAPQTRDPAGAAPATGSPS